MVHPPARAWRLVRRPLVGLLVIAAACGPDDDKVTLNDLLGTSEPTDQRRQPRVLNTVVSSIDWTPPSAALQCGQPCGADFAAACSEHAIATRCADGVIACEECGAAGRQCVAEGGSAVCERACEGEEVCPPGGACYAMMCCPNDRWCERGAQTICSDDGTEILVQPCVDGLDCFSGQCVPARPQVHVLFDSSGSMTWTPFGGEVLGKTWPLCDDPQAPQTRLGISKRAFTDLFADVQYEHVLFALQRFPQRRSQLTPVCPDGAYEPQDMMTGHHGKYTVDEQSDGSWFAESMGEVLAAPFPRSGFESNRAELMSWLDFNESADLTTDPEIRATGWTPLGTSLYYAAEYFRNYVVVDGLDCTLDADCRTSTHFCVDGLCADPNRFCRQRSIVVFTDGVDTSSLGSWLDPVVQAKRLRAGLDCATAADCFTGFLCDEGPGPPSGVHRPNPCAAGGGTGAPARRPCEGATAAGAERLRDANGDPIRITVHVVDGSGAIFAAGAGMATYGGGLLVPASLASSSSLLQAIKGVVDWKDVSFCEEQN